jgi:hypothetical protein
MPALGPPLVFALDCGKALNSVHSFGQLPGGVRMAHWRLIAAARPSRSSPAQPGKALGATGRVACADGADGGDGAGAVGAAGCASVPGRPVDGAVPGGVVQPTAIAIAQAIMATTCEDRIMWVIYLEAGLVVSLVLLIVWWTMRGK